MNIPIIAHHQERKVDANGIQLSYDSFGDPAHPPMLLIMGLATQLIHWDENFCRQLASRGFWVIRFDNRDIGNSSKMEGDKVPGIAAILANQWFGRRLETGYVLDDMAMDTLALLDALSIDRAHVVGVSMGGMIGQCMAIQAPHRLASLTSIMSTTGNRSLPKPKKRVSMAMIRPLPKDEEAFVAQTSRMWQMLHGDTYPFESDRIHNLIRTARARCLYPPGALRQLCAIMASPDRTEALADVRVPSLILHGDADPLVPLACGLATAEAIPGAKMKILEGMGHTLPKQVWPIMIDEIAGLANGSGEAAN